MDPKTSKKLTIFLFGHYPIPATQTILAVFRQRFLTETNRGPLYDQKDIAFAIEQYVAIEVKPPSWAQFKPFIDHHRGLRLERERQIDPAHRLPPPPNDPPTPESMKDFWRKVDGIVNRFSEPFVPEERRKHTPKVPDEAMTGPLCCEDGCYAPATVELEFEEWGKSIIKFCEVHTRIFVKKQSGPLTIRETPIPGAGSPPGEPSPSEPNAETSMEADAPSGLSGTPVRNK